MSEGAHPVLEQCPACGAVPIDGRCPECGHGGPFQVAQVLDGADWACPRCGGRDRLDMELGGEAGPQCRRCFAQGAVLKLVPEDPANYPAETPIRDAFVERHKPREADRAPPQAAADPQADPQDYACTLRTAHLAMRLLSQWDVPAVLRAQEQAHAVGPILDPTLYRQRAEALRQDQEILRATLPLWRLARKLYPAPAEGPPCAS